MNAPADALLLVISNSGETRNLITQIKAAQQRGIAVVAITNRKDSPIGLAADYQLLTAVRQQIFESGIFLLTRCRHDGGGSLILVASS